MKFWITGASGSLGQELRRSLVRIFPEIEVLSPTRQQLNLENHVQVKNFVKVHKPTHVFHLAAKVYGLQGHTEDPTGSLLTNTLIDNNVFAALFECPPEWIYYSSSVAAYGFPYKNLPLSETDWLSSSPHWSEFGYAMGKRHALSYLEILAKSFGTKYVYGLTTNLFGTGDRFHDGQGHVIVSLLRKALVARNKNVPLTVWGTGQASRDFLSTSDASRLLIDLVDSDAGIVNIASGQEILIKDIALDIANVFQIDSGIQFSNTNEGITRRFCSVTKLEGSLKGRHKVDSWVVLKKQIRDYYFQCVNQAHRAH